MSAGIKRATIFDFPQNKQGAEVLPLDAYMVKKDIRTGGIDLFSMEEREAYLKKFGNHCMSFSALQPGMRFFDMPGIGYIAFKQEWGQRFVLADPVCDVNDRETIIREFLKDGKPTAFAQISQGIAELLHNRFGYYSTQFGVETVIDLKNWDVKGKKKQVLRTSMNHARKDGVYFKEEYAGNGYKELTKEWIKTRKVKNREIGFLIRPMQMDYENGTRKFYAYMGEEVIGLIYFDPVYEDGRVISYVPNISRFSPKFKQGIFYPIMLHAMDIFKTEGVRHIHLGLSPMVVDGNDNYYESSIVKKIVRVLFKYGNYLYNFKGIHFTKSRFQGKDYKTFCSHKKRLPAREFITMFKLANII